MNEQDIENKFITRIRYGEYSETDESGKATGRRLMGKTKQFKDPSTKRWVNYASIGNQKDITEKFLAKTAQKSAKTIEESIEKSKDYAEKKRMEAFNKQEDAKEKLVPGDYVHFSKDPNTGATKISATPNKQDPELLPKGFSGIVYVAGKRFVMTGTKKAYVKVPFDGITAPTYESSRPDPMPDDAEYYEVANTYGDIHEARV